MVGCILVVVLMPAGSLLDFFVYRDQLWPFFQLRLACSALGAAIFGLLFTSIGKRSGKPLGIVVPLLPVVFIAAMIAQKDGFESPYYAGLNLVLLAIGAVLHWTFVESLVAVGLVLVIYLIAGWWNLAHGGSANVGRVVNNFYFIALMDIIVVVGTYFQYRQRFREFGLRFELDKNRAMLEESNQKLLELDQVKSRFFANISHELRTPLTLLLAPLETLIHRYKHAFDEETRGILLTMHSNGMRLLKLINDLLDLVRLESGRMEVKREAVNVLSFVKGLSSAARQVADDKRLRLETTVEPDVETVMLDRDKLEKIVLNLLFNALKFTPSGGSVDLIARREGEQLVLQVKDTGMGISEKNLPYVFDRFWQADGSSKRKYQGVGIGLALVKELVEIQGGKVTVESQEGKGTTFTIQLPYLKGEPTPEPAKLEAPKPAEAPVNAAKEGATVSSEEWLANLYRRAELFPAMTPLQETMRPVETARNGKRTTALVADDEPDMLRFLKSQLIQHYEVIEAVDGQQAVEKAAQFLPDIILLDMMMPEKDGLQACRELRQRSTTQGIPIVLLTARADEETKLAALSAGASDFLPKPFSTTELHVRIKNLVESYHYQRKLAKQNQLLESTIEQLKETETQLVQTEKIASLGRLSAGIIHEINNPLNFASTGLFTLRKKTKHIAPEEQEEFAEVLKDVEEGLGRVKTIVSDLRSFTHPSAELAEEVEVQEAMDAALRFLSNEVKDQVQVEIKLAPNQVLLANRNRIIQVLLNLLQNSVDALKRKTFAGEKPTIWVEGSVAPGKSIIKVRDNGVGIDPQHMDKIFDPFFTTKDVGEGMGLGLSISYRIVQEFGGHIRVRSDHGQFCEFALEFPLARGADQGLAKN
jgi:signal transduction histidine kinase